MTKTELRALTSAVVIESPQVIKRDFKWLRLGFSLAASPWTLLVCQKMVVKGTNDYGDCRTA